MVVGIVDIANAEVEVVQQTRKEDVEVVDNSMIVPGPEFTHEGVDEKKLKKVIKEGGKRGVEIEGAADMGGLKFFCNTVEEPAGSLELLVECVKAMNALSDPAEEERKGGSGKIGKMIFNMTDDALNMCAYVPSTYSECDALKWLTTVVEQGVGPAAMEKLATVSGVGQDVPTSAWAMATIKKDGDAGIFPLKLRDPAITNSYAFLKKLGLFPDDDDEEDEDYCFGDDAFDQFEEEEAAPVENYDFLQPRDESLDMEDKKMKKVWKEGGKRGVEIEGAADMGGLAFFCTEVKEPEDNLSMLVETMRAMNQKSDPTEEERKGGSGRVGKTILSMTDDKLVVVAYVPEEKTSECSASEWLVDTTTKVLQNANQTDCAAKATELVKSYPGNEGTFACVELPKKDGMFPLKMRDDVIGQAYGYLKTRGLFPDGDDESDEEDFCYGDDAFDEF